MQGYRIVWVVLVVTPFLSYWISIFYPTHWTEKNSILSMDWNCNKAVAEIVQYSPLLLQARRLHVSQYISIGGSVDILNLNTVFRRPTVHAHLKADPPFFANVRFSLPVWYITYCAHPYFSNNLLKILAYVCLQSLSDTADANYSVHPLNWEWEEITFV